jgi:hypothetical protein
MFTKITFGTNVQAPDIRSVVGDGAQIGTLRFDNEGRIFIFCARQPQQGDSYAPMPDALNLDFTGEQLELIASELKKCKA